MKPHAAVPSLRRLLAGFVALAGGALAVALTPSPVTAAATPLITLPAVPWFIGQNVAPNVLLTLDDSVSMEWAYAPDTFDNSPGTAVIAFKSNLNPMYYNATVDYVAPPDAVGNPYPTSYTAARRNGFDSTRGVVNMQTSYRPEYEYRPRNTSANLADHCPNSGNCPGVGVPKGTATEAYWWEYKPNGGTCPNTPALSAMAALATTCFEFKRPSNDAERQNFANWYSFYRTRNLSTVSAAMIGFSKLPQAYRVAWQGLSSCKGNGTNFTDTCKGWESGRASVNARIGTFTESKRAEMWYWLERLPADYGTPLRDGVRRAGDYLKLTGPGSPYADDLTATTGVQYTSCRASYHVMMTDGVWNGGTASVGNTDGTSVVLPDGVSYSPTAPFKDSYSNTIADLSFYYWATDLQPAIANNLRRFMPYQAGLSPTVPEYWDPRNDPGTWQRMTSIYVGLGLTGFLTSPVQWLGSTFAGTAATPATGYQQFKQSLAQWPESREGTSAGNVYDLWHGAINSRGAFYAADSPQTLVKAFEDLANRISSREDGASAVSSSSLQVQTDSMMFNTSFSSQRWDGTLRAYRVQADGTPEPTVAWSTDSTFNTLANGSIGSHTVFAKSASGGLVQLLPTALSSLPAARQTELAAQAADLSATMTTPIGAADLVRWVLGDKSNLELRRRDRLLGDLITSAPLFEGGRDYGYSVTAWTDTPKIDGTVYAQYVKDKQDPGTGRPKNPTVYVGSNDGMLHAFNADTGAHRWAYMPTPSFAKIGRRADPLVGHTWYVDGPIITHDIHDGTNWRTILVASTGAGARGLFALDVTNALSPTLLWEYFPNDDDLGHVVSEPVIARAQSGEWIVAFGNGYGHPSNKAMLYMLNASTGAVLKKIATGEQSTTVGNGLAAPALLYTAGKRLSYAYAGDLLGNLWRFKLSGSGPIDWSLDFGNLPLFTAKDSGNGRQPITAKIRIATDRQLGRMLLFGTGRLITAADPASNDRQSIYGIRDRADGAGTATRSDLTQQTIVTEMTNLRTVSQNNTPITGAGWYLDLDGRPSNVGERVTMAVNYMPELSLMTVSTVRPTSALDPCGSNVTSWVMAMSPFNGQGVALFDGGGSSTGAGYRLDGVLAAPTPIRKTNGTVRLTINGGTGGLAQVQIQRGWNPRAAWNQLR
jgi:type IV pilus assembly protein PilY1